MAQALTIPDIVESEPMFSVSMAPDGVTFTITIDAGDTSVRLMHASTAGQHLPLVVLTTDVQILALDSVYVTGVTISGQPAIAQVTFLAQAVRVV